LLVLIIRNAPKWRRFSDVICGVNIIIIITDHGRRDNLEIRVEPIGTCRLG
jgi:hypothetical protein